MISSPLYVLHISSRGVSDGDFDGIIGVGSKRESNSVLGFV